MLIQDIIHAIEEIAPLQYQEDYDNCGLLTGQKNWEAKAVLLSLDCTEAIIDEAIANGCNLIVAHHPILFSGIKKLNGNTYIERTLIKAIKNDIALYACHTNIDNVYQGVNHKISSLLGLQNLSILAPKSGLLKKLVTYVPKDHAQVVLNALFESGAGHIGNYDSCSFSSEGSGTFKGNENSKPFIGKTNELSRENETKIEVILDLGVENRVIKALLGAHPYEEVAYDLIPIANKHQGIGSGMLGLLKSPLEETGFLELVKKTFQSPVIKHTKKLSKPIQKVAVCGGSGRFLLQNAIQSGADAYITSDFKYHEYFDADQKILLIDVGHFESEQFTPEIFYDIIQNKFPTFAIRLSKINTNPINYF